MLFRSRAPEAEDIDTVGEEAAEPTDAEDLKAPFKNQPVVMVLPDVHEQAVKELKAGNLNAVLKLMSSTAVAKVNKYYAVLAQRLLDANITAKSVVVGTDHMEPLSNDPAVAETLDSQLKALEQAALLTLPENKHAELVKTMK